jgi:hypothetical protein
MSKSSLSFPPSTQRLPKNQQAPCITEFDESYSKFIKGADEFHSLVPLCVRRDGFIRLWGNRSLDTPINDFLPYAMVMLGDSVSDLFSIAPEIKALADEHRKRD